MSMFKRKSAGSQNRFNVLLTFVFAAVSLTILVLMLSLSAGTPTAVTYAQNPIVTPTVPFSEALQAYLDAHIVEGDVMPAATPVAPEEIETPLETTGVVSYSVDLLSNSVGMGLPGATVSYTLTLSNTGTLSDVYNLTFSSDWAISVPTTSFSLAGGASSPVAVGIAIPLGATEGDSDTAVITATSQTDALVMASVLLTTTTELQRTYFPVIAKPFPAPPVPTLSATRPNSANHWQMNWTISNATYVTGYTLQQSQDPTFVSGVTTYDLASSAVGQPINTIQASSNNVYYYRLRALGPDDNSAWSNVVEVIGAYYDDFTNNQSGWSGPTLKDALRRLTYIERTDSWYENGQWLIVRVEDSWDWLIASPLKPAPSVPYVIEYSSKPANLGNLVSHGVVFGGDWAGAPCPDWSTIQGIYQHTNCFNHFYNGNIIWSSDSDLTLLWERIDQLVWCPNCGGSPMKRLGFTFAMGIDTNASDWNNYRIEVRADSIRYFFNGELKYNYTDTRWVNEPYFGVFASTDEYSNSTWRYEYFKVTPLDN